MYSTLQTTSCIHGAPKVWAGSLLTSQRNHHCSHLKTIMVDSAVDEVIDLTCDDDDIPREHGRFKRASSFSLESVGKKQRLSDEDIKMILKKGCKELGGMEPALWRRAYEVMERSVRQPVFPEGFDGEEFDFKRVGAKKV